MDNNCDFVNAIALIHQDIKRQKQFFSKKAFENVIDNLNIIISHLQILGLTYDGSFDNETIKTMKI
jgi:hypothetical protein